jgi:hypothetical protein
MVIDGTPAVRGHWESLGGKLWLGGVSLDGKGRRVQEVKIENIPLQNALAAIKMVRARQKRVLSSDALQASRERMLNARKYLSETRSPAPKTLLEV